MHIKGCVYKQQINMLMCGVLTYSCVLCVKFSCFCVVKGYAGSFSLLVVVVWKSDKKQTNKKLLPDSDSGVVS